MSATHLFVAAPAAAFGEVSTGLRIARELVAQGDRVLFLAGADVAILFEGTGIAHQAIDGDVLRLGRLVSRTIERERCASLTLVDVASVYLTLDPIGVELDFLERLAVPVIALDFWNLRRAGPEWDFGRDATPIPPAALAFERRLLPVPIARPDAGPGTFGALPQRAARPAVRAERAGGWRGRCPCGSPGRSTGWASACTCSTSGRRRRPRGAHGARATGSAARSRPSGCTTSWTRRTCC